MKKLISILTLIFLAPQLTMAQEAASEKGFFATYQLEIVLGLAVVVCVVALLVLLVCLYALKVFMRINAPELEAEPAKKAWHSLLQNLTRAVPVAQEAEVMTTHSYDGIKELDNKLPPWWLYGFYFTIVFSVGYLLYFHVLGGPLQQEEYENEMARAEEKAATYLASQENLIDESNVEFTDTEEDLAEARLNFTSYCAACHGTKGEGGVGPNFADQYWVHGGDIKDIFKTIKYGVPAKGMISWESQLTPKQMQQLASYIITLEGTNPPNAKEPQGELYEREEMTEDVENDTTAVEAAVENS